MRNTGLVKNLRIVGKRIRSNTCIRDRLEEYIKLLRSLKDIGYENLTVGEVADLDRRKIRLPERFVVLRHDLDTDPFYALKWSEVERIHGFRASYYFRLKSMDVGLLSEIHSQGHEVGYHYEELATVVRRLGLWRREVSPTVIRRAQEEFLRNINNINERLHFQVTTAAAHGDFANRFIGVPNTVLLENREFRGVTGITSEAYDERIVRNIKARVSDRMGEPHWKWSDSLASSTVAPLNDSSPDPIHLMAAGVNSLQILTHPRHWRSNVQENFREDIYRVVGGMLLRLNWPSDFRSARTRPE